jgi:uncharacterized protein (TIGR02145 family)
LNGTTWQTSATFTVSPGVTTTYTLYATPAAGCTASLANAATVTVATPVITSLTSATICTGEAATLTADVSGAASYSLNGSTWTTSNTFTVDPTTTTYYTLYAINGGCTASLPNAATVTVHPDFTAGAIDPASDTALQGTDPGETVTNSISASGGDGNIIYQWRRSGTSSATLTGSAATYPISNNTTNYAAAGTYYITRYAHDGTCNTAWVASTGTYTLTVKAWPPGAGTKTYSCGTQTWSEPVRIAACDQSSWTNSNTSPYCRSDTYNDIKYYYYNWTYVSWAGVSMCPSPWRVPSTSDVAYLLSCLGTTSFNGVYYPENSKWGGALAGNAIDARMNNQNVYGYYWTSVLYNNNNYAYFMYCGPSAAACIGGEKKYGMQVRCVRSSQ